MKVCNFGVEVKFESEPGRKEVLLKGLTGSVLRGEGSGTSC